MADGLDGARRNQQSRKAFGALSYSPGLALRISIRRCPTRCNALNLGRNRLSFFCLRSDIWS